MTKIWTNDSIIKLLLHLYKKYNHQYAVHFELLSFSTPTKRKIRFVTIMQLYIASENHLWIIMNTILQ